MLYRLGKRGHRFKCWECGVKKKAPCGDTHRADLPWCCHRRLGAHIAVLAPSFREPGSSCGGSILTADVTLEGVRDSQLTKRPAPGPAMLGHKYTLQDLYNTGPASMLQVDSMQMISQDLGMPSHASWHTDAS